MKNRRDWEPSTDRQKECIRYLAKALALPNLTEQNIGSFWINKKVASRTITLLSRQLALMNDQLLKASENNKALSLLPFNQKDSWKTLSNLVIFKQEILSNWGKNSLLIAIPGVSSENGNSLAISIPKGGLETEEKQTKQIVWEHSGVTRQIQKKQIKIDTGKFIIAGIDFSRRYRIYEIINEKEKVKFIKYKQKPWSIVQFYRSLKLKTEMTKESLNEKIVERMGIEFTRLGVADKIKQIHQEYELFMDKFSSNKKEEAEVTKMIEEWYNAAGIPSLGNIEEINTS